MNVLLVEDSEMLRIVIKESLMECKELVMEKFAANQAEAIKLLDEEQFDMMLVDIELAEGNGFEVIKHTQTPEYRFKRPVVIMLTNHTYPHYRNSAKQLGISHFFDKSMEFDLAVETIITESDKFTAALSRN
ncbi:MAG TPA: response regulator [Methylophilaceae bacterium]|jgi:DNA-binding NarL/FixJ family response regulator